MIYANRVDHSFYGKKSFLFLRLWIIPSLFYCAIAGT